MKQLSTIVLAAAVLLGVPLTAAVAATGPPRAVLRGMRCERAVDPLQRQMSITAVMRPVPGTRKLQMKIELLSRTAGSQTFSSVTVPAQSKLDTWISPSNPTLGQRPGDIWKVPAPVADLSQPATYRYQVVFEWLGAGGKVLRSTQRLSRPCREPELRPDLYVQSFSAQAIAGRPKLDQYIAVIGNDGATAAKDFAAEFSDGTVTATHQVTRLAPHATKTLTFVGPICATGAPPALALDPQHVIEDLNPGNNDATATCPASSAAAPAPAS